MVGTCVRTDGDALAVPDCAKCFELGDAVVWAAEDAVVIDRVGGECCYVVWLALLPRCCRPARDNAPNAMPIAMPGSGSV